jgi:hypothetical protein
LNSQLLGLTKKDGRLAEREDMKKMEEQGLHGEEKKMEEKKKRRKKVREYWGWFRPPPWPRATPNFFFFLFFEKIYIFFIFFKQIKIKNKLYDTWQDLIGPHVISTKSTNGQRTK